MLWLYVIHSSGRQVMPHLILLSHVTIQYNYAPCLMFLQWQDFLARPMNGNDSKAPTWVVLPLITSICNHLVVLSFFLYLFMFTHLVLSLKKKCIGSGNAFLMYSSQDPRSSYCNYHCYCGFFGVLDVVSWQDHLMKIHFGSNQLMSLFIL